MAKNNFDELASLHEELQYNSRKNLFKSKPNEEKYQKLGKNYIFNYYAKKLANNEDEYVQRSIEVINKSIKGKKIENISSPEDISLASPSNTKSEYKDLKKKIQYEEIAHFVKQDLSKELVILEENKIKYAAQIAELRSKETLSKFENKKIKRLNIKNTRNNIRIKDVNSFIKNKATYKKVYLSDEPPLSTAGWVKLFITYGILIFWAMLIIWPLFELVKSTTNNAAVQYLDTSDYSFGFNSFSRLFSETDYIKWITNTLIVAGITSAFTVVLALLMGYAFSRFRFKGKKTSLLSVMLVQMVPTMASLTVFYVIYTILNQSYKISGLTVLILIYIGGGVAGNTFIMKGYMDSISMEIDEAAKIDGLSQWRIFTRIIVPLTKPMIALVALWSFIGPFGDYILPGLLLGTDTTKYTVAKGLNTLVHGNPRVVDQPAFAAGSILIAVPISILFISLRKFLVGGITAGGVKG